MKYVFSTTLALTLLAAAPALAKGGDTIDVMTQNQYLGGDLTPITTAKDPIEFNEAVVGALEKVSARPMVTRPRLCRPKWPACPNGGISDLIEC